MQAPHEYFTLVMLVKLRLLETIVQYLWMWRFRIFCGVVLVIFAFSCMVVMLDNTKYETVKSLDVDGRKETHMHAQPTTRLICACAIL